MPRKWSIRYSCDSSMYWWMSAASARADSRSCPKGFSTTTRAFFVETRVGQSLDHRPEQERRDLEIEHRAFRRADRVGDALVRRGVAEVAVHVREPAGEPVEHLVVDLLAGRLDRGAGVARADVGRPGVDGHADDRAVEQAPLLEPVERVERHHLRQVAGDPEDHEHVGDGLTGCPAPGNCGVLGRDPTAVVIVRPSCGVNRLRAMLGVARRGPASPHPGESAGRRLPQGISQAGGPEGLLFATGCNPTRTYIGTAQVQKALPGIEAES